MKRIFTHPVILKATPRGQALPRDVIGTVDTEVEIAEYASSEVATAFSFPYGGDPVVSVGGKLFAKQNAVSLDGGAVTVDPDWDGSRAYPDGYAFYSIVERLLDVLRDVQRDGRLFPHSKHFPMSRLDEGSAFAMAVSAGPISGRRLLDIDHGAVDLWRNHAHAFFENVVLVDGQIHLRCHEPVIAATVGGTYRHTASIHRLHLDGGKRDMFGLPAMGQSGRTLGYHVFPADMAREAEEFVASYRDHGVPAYLSPEWKPPVVAHIETMSHMEMLEAETVRHLRVHVMAEHDARTRKLAASAALDRELPAPTGDEARYRALAETALGQLLDIDRGRGDMQDIETSLESVLEGVRAAHPVGALKDMLVDETEMHLSRMASAPILLERVTASLRP